MSRLQELTERYCPDGVEYKALGEIGELVKGSGLQKKDFTEDGVGCIHYGQIHSRFGTYTDRVVAHVPEMLAERLTVVHPGDLVVAVTSEDVAACCKAVAWIGDEDIVTGGHCVVIRHDLDARYLSYCFQTTEFYKQKKRFAAGVKVTEMRTDRLARIMIPVPPIEVQREIVRLLDAYTAAHDALVAKLNEETELKAKSLAAYRETLLTFAESVRWATLDEVCNVGRGTYITGKEVVPGDIPVILGGKEPAYYHNVANHEGEAIVVSRSGVNAGYASYWNQPIFVSDGFVVDMPEDGVLLQYVFRYLEMKQPDLIAMNRGSGVPHITGKMLKDVMVPIPDMDEQLDIINKLDCAAGAYARLISALREEDDLRWLQLAEFRNQLLSFPEKVA